MFTIKTDKELDITIFIAGESETFDDWMQMLIRYSKSGQSKYELYDLIQLKTSLSEDEIRRLVSTAGFEPRQRLMDYTLV